MIGNVPLLDRMSKANAARTALALAALVNVFIVFVAADANQAYMMGSHIVLPIVRSAALAGLFLLLAVQLYRQWRAPDLLTIVLIAYAFVGTILGVLFGNDPVLLARHLFAGLTMAVSYWLGMVLSKALLPLAKDMRAWSWITLFASLVLFVFVFADLGVSTTTTSPTPLLLTFAAGLAVGPIWVAILAAVLIAVGNNRTAVIGLCISLAAWILSRHQSIRRPSRIALASVLAPILFIAISLLAAGANRVAGGAYSYFGIGEPPVVAERLSRSIEQMIGEPPELRAEKPAAAAGPDIPVADYLTSGRTIELGAVVQTVRNNGLKLLLGAGFGSTFEFSYYSWNLEQTKTYTRYQPDMALSYFLLTGGIIFLVAISLLFAHRLLRIFIAAVSGDIAGTGVLFMLGYSAGNLVGFIPNTPLLWLLIGTYWAAIAPQASSHTGADVECAGAEK